MAEVLVQFDEPQHTADGRVFIAQVLGRRTSAGCWEGWIEFFPLAEGEPVRTACETEQFTRGDLRYWAACLTAANLDAALSRALALQSHPAMSGGAGAHAGATRRTQLAEPAFYSMPALDPAALLRERGEYALRQELRILEARELREIIAAYDIPELDTVDLARTFEDALAERIVAGVQQSAGIRRDTLPTAADITAARPPQTGGPVRGK